MSRIWMVTLAMLFAISLFGYVCPADTRADAGIFEVNVEYLKNKKFSPDQKLLELKVVLKDKFYSDGTREEFPKKIKFYTAPKSSKSVDCTFGASRTVEPLDCGLVPMSLSAYDIQYSYAFKVLKQEGDWLQVSAPSAAAEFLWINKKEHPELKISGFDMPEIAVRTMPLSEWILYLYGFGIVDTNVDHAYIYANPDEKSKVLGSCKSAGDNAKGGLMKTRDKKKDVWGEIKGDWARVFCDGLDCYAEDSPDFLFSDEVPAFQQEEERRKKLKNCVRGWVRWRANDGKILLYPALSISH